MNAAELSAKYEDAVIELSRRLQSAETSRDTLRLQIAELRLQATQAAAFLCTWGEPQGVRITSALMALRDTYDAAQVKALIEANPKAVWGG